MNLIDVIVFPESVFQRDSRKASILSNAALKGNSICPEIPISRLETGEPDTIPTTITDLQVMRPEAKGPLSCPSPLPWHNRLSHWLSGQAPPLPAEAPTSSVRSPCSLEILFFLFLLWVSFMMI